MENYLLLTLKECVSAMRGSLRHLPRGVAESVWRAIRQAETTIEETEKQTEEKASDD